MGIKDNKPTMLTDFVTAGTDISSWCRLIGPSDGLESAGSDCSVDIHSAANGGMPRLKVHNNKADPSHASATHNINFILLRKMLSFSNEQAASFSRWTGADSASGVPNGKKAHGRKY
jgi:hypothetical protein